MGTIKKLSLFCFISLLSTFCFARQLCFQIVQHDSAAKELTEQSLTIEDEVLNSFLIVDTLLQTLMQQFQIHKIKMKHCSKLELKMLLMVFQRFLFK